MLGVAVPAYAIPKINKVPYLAFFGICVAIYVPLLTILWCARISILWTSSLPFCGRPGNLRNDDTYH